MRKTSEGSFVFSYKEVPKDGQRRSSGRATFLTATFSLTTRSWLFLAFCLIAANTLPLARCTIFEYPWSAKSGQESFRRPTPSTVLCSELLNVRVDTARGAEAANDFLRQSLKFTMTRFVGNSLPPLQGPDQARQNIRHIVGKSSIPSLCMAFLTTEDDTSSSSSSTSDGSGANVNVTIECDDQLESCRSAAFGSARSAPAGSFDVLEDNLGPSRACLSSFLSQVAETVDGAWMSLGGQRATARCALIDIKRSWLVNRIFNGTERELMIKDFEGSLSQLYAEYPFTLPLFAEALEPLRAATSLNEARNFALTDSSALGSTWNFLLDANIFATLEGLTNALRLVLKDSFRAGQSPKEEKERRRGKKWELKRSNSSTSFTFREDAARYLQIPSFKFTRDPPVTALRGDSKIEEVLSTFNGGSMIRYEPQQFSRFDAPFWFPDEGQYNQNNKMALVQSIQGRREDLLCPNGNRGYFLPIKQGEVRVHEDDARNCGSVYRLGYHRPDRRWLYCRDTAMIALEQQLLHSYDWGSRAAVERRPPGYASRRLSLNEAQAEFLANVEQRRWGYTAKEDAYRKKLAVKGKGKAVVVSSSSSSALPRTRPSLVVRRDTTTAATTPSFSTLPSEEDHDHSRDRTTAVLKAQTRKWWKGPAKKGKRRSAEAKRMMTASTSLSLATTPTSHTRNTEQGALHVSSSNTPAFVTETTMLSKRKQTSKPPWRKARKRRVEGSRMSHSNNKSGTKRKR